LLFKGNGALGQGGRRPTCQTARQCLKINPSCRWPVLTWPPGQLEHLNLLITDSGEFAVQKVLELAIGAKELWKTMNRQERVDYLKNVCSNPTLDDLTLHYRLEKPFEKLAEMKGNRNWRR